MNEKNNSVPELSTKDLASQLASWAVPVVGIFSLFAITQWFTYVHFIVVLAASAIIYLLVLVYQAPWRRVAIFRITAPPVIFLLCVQLQFLFLENDLYRWVFYGLLFLGLGIYSRALLAQRLYPERYPAATLLGVVTALMFIGLFLFAAGLFNIRIFLRPSLFELIPFGWFIIGGMFFVLGQWHQLSARALGWYGGVSTFFTGTWLAALFLWPTSSYVNSFVVAGAGFILHTSLVQVYGSEQQPHTIRRRYVIFAAVVLALVLATARWVI